MPPSRVRWGLLSTARINERLISVLQTSARSELCAVASGGGPDKAASYAAQWGIARAYGTYEALLADPEIDAIYVSLPNAMHLAWVLRAAEAGKHVLCEKPLAVSAAEVDQMQAAAHRGGVTVQEAVMMRYHPQTADVRRLLAEGAIGDVRLIRGAFTFTLAREGDIRLNATLGGGSIWDLGSYPISFIRTVLRAEPAEAQGWQVGGADGVDLSFGGQMRFAAGPIAQFFCSFQAFPVADLEIVGSGGRIHLDLPYVNRVGVTSSVRVLRAGQERAAGTFSDSVSQLDEETLTYENVNGYRHEVESMEACLLDGAEPVVSLAESRGNVAAVEALRRSAREGRVVRLEPKTGIMGSS